MAKKKTTKTSARKTASARKSSATRKSASTTKKSKTATKKPASAKKKTTSKKKPVTRKKSTARTSKKKTVTKKKTTSKSTASKSKVKKKVTEKKAPPPVVEKKKKTVKPKKPPLKPGQVKITKGRSVLEVATGAVADEHGYVMVNGRRVRMISTKGITSTTKKKRSKKVTEVEIIQKPTPPKPIKTKLSKKELNHYKNLLLIKRAEIVGDLTTIEAEALRSNDGDLSNMPIHMADLGSDTYEQDLMLGMAESERQRLREIDEALLRIQNRTYGVCQMTGKTIPTARLEAKPWAKYTIESARQLEGQWGA